MSLNLDLLKKNQHQALNSSIDNDFQSGIHYHATGSGKSWIAMYILEAFYNKYPQGNVLWICERKDPLNKKKYGLVIDLKARSTIEVCNIIQHYLKLKDVFPWNYITNELKLDNKNYYINTLDMIDGSKNKLHLEVEFNKTYLKEDIYQYFVREIPNKTEYQQRLDYEIELILSKNLFGNMVRAIEILNITKNIINKIKFKFKFKN